MKAKPKQAAPVRGTVHAETGKPPVKASKPVKAAKSAAVAFDPVKGIVRAAGAKPAAEIVEKAIKARAAAIGIDPKKVFVGMVGAKPATPAKPAEVKKADAKPAPAPKPAPVKPVETWLQMVARHASELRKLNVSTTPPTGPAVRFLSGVYVPADNATAYRDAMTRHAQERATLRDNPATARAVFEYALTAYKGDEVPALFALGVMFTADAGGIVAPALRRTRALAEVWRDALQAVKPGAVSKLVTVRALGKPAEKPAEKPATPAKADAKAKPADKPAKVEKPVGMGMVAKIEAKPDKPAKVKPKK